MADGAPARLYEAWLPLRPTDPHGARVGVTLVRDLVVIDARIRRNGAILWGSTAVVVLLAAAVASLVVRRSLRPVSRLSAVIGSIDAASLGSPLELQDLPEELRPPFVKVNELLARIASSLARERQFSADVSHELRTPLAGLRAILEVSAARDRPAGEYRAGLGEALEVVHQLEAIVDDLILLARLGAGQGARERREPLRLRDLVEACFAPHAEAARRRRLRFEDRVAPEVALESEKVKLRLVIANLLSNAVAYTAEGGWIAVESDPSGGLVLAVRDSGPTIPEGALSRIFDPFFRLDTARSGSGEHCGVGLALVRGLCDALGYRVEARNEPDGSVAFLVSQPAAPARQALDAGTDAGALSR
jgi:signal transduction histidine kinase